LGQTEVAVNARRQLILKRASRLSGNRSEDDYDVLADGIVVGPNHACDYRAG